MVVVTGKLIAYRSASSALSDPFRDGVRMPATSSAKVRIALGVASTTDPGATTSEVRVLGCYVAAAPPPTS